MKLPPKNIEMWHCPKCGRINWSNGFCPRCPYTSTRKAAYQLKVTPFWQSRASFKAWEIMLGVFVVLACGIALGAIQ